MTPGELSLALRRIRSDDRDLGKLPERERALVSASASDKRRSEFVAGRAAARLALERLLGADARDATIERDDASRTARPVARSATGALLPVHVSITHAGGVAAAAAARERIGLDLVSFEPLEPAFLEEAFARGELAAWARWTRAAGPRIPCLAFAAKEAAVKWLGTGLAVPLGSVVAVPAGPGYPVRLGGVAALAFPLQVEARGGTTRLDATVACSVRRVLLCARGHGS